MNSNFAKLRIFLGILGVVLVVVLGATTAQAGSISGTLSNFDTYYDNTETPSIDAYGAEIELEDIHSTDVQTTYPSNYNSSLTTDISDLGNGHFGTRIRFDGYNFPGTSGFIAPNPNPPSTNGHACVGTAGCEHFGFSASVQPTAMRFFWLDQSGSRIGSTPLTIPNPTWTYVPPAARCSGENASRGRRSGTRGGGAAASRFPLDENLCDRN